MSAACMAFGRRQKLLTYKHERVPFLRQYLVALRKAIHLQWPLPASDSKYWCLSAAGKRSYPFSLYCFEC